MQNKIKLYLLSYPISSLYVKKLQSFYCNDLFSFLIIKDSIIKQMPNILTCKICKTNSFENINYQNKYKCGICNKTIDIVKNTIFYSRKQPIEYYKIIKCVSYYLIGIKILQLTNINNKYHTLWTIKEMQTLTKLNENQIIKLYKKIPLLLTNYNNKPQYYFNILKKQIDLINNDFLQQYEKLSK
jgi:hypothetical protein